MLKFHIDNDAELTVAGVEVPISQASAFGVIGCDDRYQITTWEEKPRSPKPVPGKYDVSFVSMGVYIFNTDTLVRNAIADAKKKTSHHDFGKDVVPAMIKNNRVFVYNFREANNEAGRYWRDIGTIDAYWEANMDLCSPDPQCNLYGDKWPIRTYQEQVPPAKIVMKLGVSSKRDGSRNCQDTIISGGCVIYESTVKQCVLSPNVRVDPRSLVESSVLLDGVHVGAGARIRKAILDQGVEVPDGYSIGFDQERDASLFTVSPNGIVVVPRGMALR